MAGNPSALTVGKRDLWFDNIKGILMVFVVIGHFSATLVSADESVEIIYKIINSFHMPCFMIVTGYLSQRRVRQKDYSKMFTRLIIPYFTAQLLVYLSAALIPNGLHFINVQSAEGINFFTPSYHLWFLCAVILFNLITPKLSELFAKCPYVLLLLSFALSAGVGYCAEVFALRLTKSIAFYPFFLIGFFCKKEFILHLKSTKWIKAISAAVFLCACGLFIKYNDFIFYKIFPMATPYDKYSEEFTGAYPVAARCVLLAAAPIISFAFMSLVPKCKTIFTYVGQRSMYVYVLHGIFVIYLRTVSKYYFDIYGKIDKWYEITAFLLLCVGLTFVLASTPVKKAFGWILEPKINLPKRNADTTAAAAEK